MRYLTFLFTLLSVASFSQGRFNGLQNQLIIDGNYSLQKRVDSASIATAIRWQTTPDYQPVFEDRVRKPNANWQYTGTVRNVGAGQTYTTISAAISAAVSGDIIQIADGTYLTSAESGGYLLINDVSKRVLIRGNPANRGAVIIQQNASAAYGVRIRTSNEVTFKDLTITSNQVNSLGDGGLFINLQTPSSPSKVCFDNCVITNTSTSSVPTVGLQGAPTNINYVEFKGCDLISNSNATSAPLRLFSSMSDADATTYPSPILITGGTITGAISFVDNAIDITMYDVVETQPFTSSSYVFGIGADIAQPVNFGSKVDIRGCTFKYLYSYFGHAVLLGRGTKNVYFINNKCIVPSIANSLALGLVIKSIATAVGDVVIEGNYVEAPFPILLKGSKNVRCRYNTGVSVYPDATDGYGFRIDNPNNPDGVISSTGNIVTYNTFTGRARAITLSTASGATSAKTSAQACTIDYNRYKVTSATTYINNDGSLLSWASKSTFWGNSNDANSIIITP